MRRTVAAGLGTLAVLVGAGCSGPSAPETPAPPSAAASSAAPSSTAGSSSAGCPDGTYTITRLQGQGSASALGTGTGGDATMTFGAGRWQLSSDGGQPIRLDVGPTTADLTLVGEISGDYTGDRSSLAFTVGDASGSATIKGLGISKKSSMRTIANQLVPAGTTGSADCTGDQATLTLPTVILTLTRS